MKILISIILITSQYLAFGQETKDWRLFPGKQQMKDSIKTSIDDTKKIDLDFSKEPGIISIKQPKAIDSLTKKLRNSPYILGYTVQLEVSQQTSKIRDARYKLLKLKPDAPIDENYAAPNTYLYGGAFYTRTDAYEFKNAIKSYFPNAIVIARKLALPPLENN